MILIKIFFQAIIIGYVIGRTGGKEERNKKYEV